MHEQPDCASDDRPHTPQKEAAQEGATRRVGTCRHSCRGTVTVVEEAVLCHVVHWLDLPDINRLHPASGKLPGYILATTNEDTNNVLARWNEEVRTRATTGAAMVLGCWETCAEPQQRPSLGVSCHGTCIARFACFASCLTAIVPCLLLILLLLYPAAHRLPSPGPQGRQRLNVISSSI